MKNFGINHSWCQGAVSYRLLTAIICLFCEPVQSVDVDTQWKTFDDPLASAHPCNTRDITVRFDGVTLSPKEVNQYYVYLNKVLPTGTLVRVTFDADVSVAYAYRYGWKTDYLRAGFTLNINTIATRPGLRFKVTGMTPGLPYLISFKIDDLEYCPEPDTKFLMKYIKDRYVPKDTYFKFSVSDFFGVTSFPCGRRRAIDTGAVADGDANPGDWPWHAAVYPRRGNGHLQYKCGGSLISNNYVLTAAQCIRTAGFKNGYVVALGKHNLQKNDSKTIAIEVEYGFTPPGYDAVRLTNDIALLKLKSEVQFTDYIQPACLWYKRKVNVPTDENLVGAFVGWGSTDDDSMPLPLQQVNLPIVSAATCVRSHPTFKQILTNNDFCAGYHNNGTSPCNGDSGGALQIFIPDTIKDENGEPSGTWYVKGVLSKAIPDENTRTICDVNQYTIFTDVDKFAPWIDSHVDG